MPDQTQAIVKPMASAAIHAAGPAKPTAANAITLRTVASARPEPVTSVQYSKAGPTLSARARFKTRPRVRNIPVNNIRCARPDAAMPKRTPLTGRSMAAARDRRYGAAIAYESQTAMPASAHARKSRGSLDELTWNVGATQ